MNGQSAHGKSIPQAGGGKMPHETASSGPILQVMEMLTQMAEDTTLPRNVRRGAQGAWEELARETVAVDVRVASAVGILDDLANAVNLPVHGRTSIWSVISRLESLQ